jgi:hypothetical protein
MMKGMGPEIQVDPRDGYDSMWIAMHHIPVDGNESLDAYFERVIGDILPGDLDRRGQEKFVHGARLAFETNFRNAMVANRQPFWTSAGPFRTPRLNGVRGKIADIIDRGGIRG